MMKYWIVLLISGLLSACSSFSEWNPDDLVAAYADKEYPLQVEREIQDINYSAKYLPPAVSMLEALNYPDMQPMSPDSLAQLQEAYAQVQHFVLKINSEKKKNLLGKPGDSNPEFAEKLSYLNSTVQEDFYLINGGDTLPCDFAHFERSYNLENSITLIVGFKLRSADIKADPQLLFDDQFTGTGPVLFSFDQDDIEQFNKRISI